MVFFRAKDSLCALAAAALYLFCGSALLAQPQTAPTPHVVQASPTATATPVGTRPTVRVKKVLQPSEIIVGVVGNRVLTKEQLDRKVEKLLPKQTPSTDQEIYMQDRRAAEGRLLYDWADVALLAVEAEAQGLTVTDEELTQGIEKLKQAADHPVDIDATLAKAGVFKTEFLNEMRDAFLGDKLIRREMEKEFPEPKLRAFYEERRMYFIHPATVRASHIFKGFRGTPTKEEKKELRDKMEELHKRALAGEDFDGLAKESDAFSRTHGGDLGWLEAKNFLPIPVGEALFRLKVGEMSKVIESEFGYHLIKVTDTRPPQGNTYETARDEVVLTVYTDVRKRLLQSLLSKHAVILNAGGIPENLLGKAAQSK
jgi:peptidyl-prolyl cis-trans isomerase C